MNRQICPLCRREAKVEWDQRHHASNVSCAHCQNYVIYHAFLAEIERAHLGRGAFAKTLPDLIRAVQERAIVELSDVTVVRAELHDFLENEG